MLIAKIDNGQVVKVADHTEWFANIPTPEELTANGFMPVNLFKPFDRLTEKLVPAMPYIDGEFVTTVAVEAMTADEIQSQKDSALAQIRSQRVNLLQGCDYTQLKDFAGTNQAAWATYRQELRDLPQTIVTDGDDPRTFNNWPVDPNQMQPSM
jgi:hypothetical protein